MKLLLILGLCTQVHGSMTDADLFKIFVKIAQVESTCHAQAWNKAEDARGIVQIRKLYLIDANQFLDTKYSHNDCFYPHISFKLFKAYMRLYKASTFEECARLHNAGPNWRNKLNKTDKYWNKVKVLL